MANAKDAALVKDAKTALADCLKVIEMLMPGLRNISVPDYALVNEAPIRARRVIAALEKF